MDRYFLFLCVQLYYVPVMVLRKRHFRNANVNNVFAKTPLQKNTLLKGHCKKHL